MSYNDLPPFTFTFEALLKTREQIKAIVQISVGIGGSSFIEILARIMALESTAKEIENAVSSYAASITNRWALQFSSAEVVLDPSAYHSLTAQLLAIASSEFIIRRVIVQQIVPVSERIPEPIIEPHKPSFADKVMSPIREAIPAFKAMQEMQTQIQKSEPELWNDPFLGGLTTVTTNKHGFIGHQDGKLKSMFNTIIARILTNGNNR